MRHLLIASALLFSFLASPLHAQDEKDAPKESTAKEKKVGESKADDKPVLDKTVKAPTITKQRRAILWVASFEKALEQAKKADRPVIVDFEAEWCGWCKKLDRDTYSNDKVIQLVNSFFVAVKVDTDKHPAISKHYKVSGLPTILVLSPDGAELQRMTGFRPPEKFLGELRKSTDAVSSLKELKASADKNPDDLDAQRAYARAVFVAGNTDDAIKALGKILEKHPENPALLLELGDMLRGSEKPQEARKLYEKLLKIASASKKAPKETLESAEKAYLPLARIQIGAKSLDAATKTITSFIETFPKSFSRAEAHLLRAYVFAMNDNSERSIADLDAVIALAPDSEIGLKASYIVDLVRRDR
jgi:thiol:disulfide interchange protein DsbD